MKAITISAFGGKEVLRVTESPVPEPGEGEVLVHVCAAGVNPVDWKIRAGYLKDRFPHTFPIVLGWDMAGVIEKCGYAARRFAPGDEVYGYCRRPVIQHGTYTEYLIIPECYLALRPKRISCAEAGAIPLAGLTAYQSLFDAAKLSGGETLVVLGASGGVGSFAVQLGKIAGARVLAVASAKNHDYLKTLGADAVIDYQAGNVGQAIKAAAPAGADVVFDCVGPDAMRTVYDCVKRGGRVVSILVAQSDLAASAGAHHFYVFVEPNATELDRLRGFVDEGRLKVHVSATFPLQDAAKAQELMETGHTRGKIVLTM